MAVPLLQSLEDFKLTKPPLGKGSFGTVYQATRIRDKKAFALKKTCEKTLDIDEEQYAKQLEEAEKEAETHRNLIHPNIIRFDSYFYDKEEQCFCLVMELAEGVKNAGSTLRHVLNKINGKSQLDPTIDGPLRSLYLKWIIQIASALAYLHKGLVFYRDLKPENILMNNNLDIKLADFGQSRKFTGASTIGTYKYAGTEAYMAPEVKKKGEEATFKADVWALGVIIAEMFFKAPVDQIQSLATIDEEGKFVIKYPTTFNDEDAKYLLSKTLEINPMKRTSSADLQSILEDKFGYVLGKDYDIQEILTGIKSETSSMMSGLSLQPSEQKTIGSIGGPGASAIVTTVEESKHAPQKQYVGTCTETQSIAIDDSNQSLYWIVAADGIVYAGDCYNKRLYIFSDKQTHTIQLGYQPWSAVIIMGRLCIGGGDDKQVHVYSLGTQPQQIHQVQLTGNVYSLCPINQYTLLAGQADGYLAMVDVKEGTCVKNTNVSDGRILDMCLCGSFETVALACGVYGLVIVDSKSLSVKYRHKVDGWTVAVSYVRDNIVITNMGLVIDYVTGQRLQEIGMAVLRIISIDGWSGSAYSNHNRDRVTQANTFIIQNNDGVYALTLSQDAKECKYKQIAQVKGKYNNGIYVEVNQDTLTIHTNHMEGKKRQYKQLLVQRLAEEAA